MTRDRRVAQGQLADLRFVITDTPGFEELNREEKQDEFNVSVNTIYTICVYMYNVHVCMIKQSRFMLVVFGLCSPYYFFFLLKNLCVCLGFLDRYGETSFTCT